jgi:hypothetical protein
MKKYFILILVFILSLSCSNDDDSNNSNSESNQFNDFPIPELQAPNVILNDLAKGIIEGDNISSIFYQRHNVHPFDYYFEFQENSNKLKKIIIRDPGYLCEVTYIDYIYREDKLIDEIRSNRINTCLEFEVKKTYKYNYNNGYLESIIMDNESLIEENYFSYNSNGTIATIYSDFRSLSDYADGYVKTSFIYDSNGNVIEYTSESPYSSTYDRKYSFTYDTNFNNFKGFFVIYSFNQPSFGIESGNGPFFLSNNNVTSTKKEYLYNDNAPQYEYFTSNYINGKLMDYGSEDGYQYWHRYYLNY